MIQVLIPTYNRSKCIELLLRDCINLYQGELFKFVLLDSSTNDDTKALAENSEKIEYRRFEPSVKVDDKVIGEILKCTDDYYWLLGDGNLVDFNRIEDFIMSLTDFDVLEIDYINSKRNTKSIKEYFESHDDLINYIRLCYSHLTYWGASIVRTAKAKALFESDIMGKYRKDSNSWWSGALVAEMISEDMAKGVITKIFTLFTNCMWGNPEKKEQSWAKGENYFLLAFDVFDKDVYMLPKCFDEVKNDIIRIFRDDALVTRTYLIRLKRRGVIKPRYVLKYKNEIQHVRGYYSFIFALACIPSFCINAAYTMHKFVKGGKCEIL